MPETSQVQSPTLTPTFTRLIAAALLAILAILLITSAREESQTFDESTHLFAGFEYWKHADFGRNPEHPPFIKLLASIPLLSMGLKEPPSLPIPFFKAQDLFNGVQLLYSSDADANTILFRGRLVIMLFTLTLALLVFLATNEIFGPMPALFALFLFTFQPLILANGKIVATDVALACLLFASVYTFYRFCNRPSAPRLALCVLATSLSIITKHSGVLVFPILVLLALVDLYLPATPATSALGNKQRHLRQLALALCAIVVTGYIALWAVYGFRYAARPGQLQITPSLSIYLTQLHHPLQHNIIAFFARHHLFPEAYLYGWIDILSIPDFRPTFLFGHVYGTHQWFFFPAVFLVKTTLALLIFLLLLPFARIIGRRRALVFFALPAVFFFLVCIASGMNMGARYLIPMYPFCILLAGASAAAFFDRSRTSRIAVSAVLVLTLISALHAYPNFLVYSNELFGGPSHTYRSVTDPDADWGQGLKWTKTYLDQHPDPNCWFDYHGNPGVNPSYFGIHCRPLLTGFEHTIGMGSAPIPSTITGTVLVSSTDIDGILWGPGDLNPYATFRDRKPDATIANIIFVYHGTFNLPLLAAETNASAATTLLRQGRLPQALTFAQTAAQQAPDAADVNAILGQVLLASGQVPAGQEALAKALHLAQTNHPEYQQSLISRLQHPPTHP
jgi:hypothetical protein